MNRCREICDCGGKVFWIGEDEHGNVAAVGQDLCVISGEALAHRRLSYSGQALDAFIDGELLTISTEGAPYTLHLGKRPVAELPGSTLGIYDTCYLPAERRLYLINGGSLVRVDLRTGSASIVAHGMFDEDSTHPRYERIASADGRVVLYQYGMRIWEDESGAPLFGDDWLYSPLTISRGGLILAAEVDSDRVCVIDRSMKVVSEAHVPGEQVKFLAFAGEVPVVTWGQAFKDTGAGVLEDGVLKKWVSLDGITVECTCVIEEMSLVALGTLDGQIILWDIARGSLRRVPVPDSPRILELHWSSRLRTLFAGARHGEVYGLTLHE